MSVASDTSFSPHSVEPCGEYHQFLFHNDYFFKDEGTAKGGSITPLQS